MHIKEVEQLVLGHTANQWQSWASPEAFLSLEPRYLIHTFVYLFIQHQVIVYNMAKHCCRPRGYSKGWKKSTKISCLGLTFKIGRGRKNK